jgi:hypothetical protein
MILQSKPSVYLLLGKQDSGKTFLLRDLFYSMSKNKFFEFGYAYSASSHYANKECSLNFLDKKHIFNGFKEKHLQGYIEGLIKIKEELQAQGKEMPHNFIIFEDVLGLIHFESEFMKNWMCKYRHTNTSIFFCAQYLKGGVGTNFREYCKYVFIFKQNTDRSKEALYKEFGTQWFEREDDFCQYLTDVTKQKYHCLLYIHGNETFEESWFDHCAGEPPKFMMNYKIP